MQAAVVRAFGTELSIDDIPMPAPGPGQALVKLVASGVCHTDLHAAEGDWPIKPSPPFIPGHEGVGTVVALGEGVTGLRLGQLVGNAWLFSACGECQYCNTGWETLCEKQQNAGYTIDGSFGQYMLVDAKFAAVIPEGADPVDVAPILCAGVTVYKGLKMTETKPGQWVVISGIGGLGHIAVQYAKAMGLRVAAVDIADDKLALAKKH
ncbi:MAG TPA: zinc-dependent alcohol dehydrogenase, partial [Intrasporangium sp.]|nr:zinc-dependent alcohol dehydrogenase [Intrasporangium sp.]